MIEAPLKNVSSLLSSITTNAEDLKKRLTQSFLLGSTLLQRAKPVVPVTPPSDRSLDIALTESAAGKDASVVEALANGAVTSDETLGEVLKWCAARVTKFGLEEGSVAALTGVVRARSYKDLIKWANTPGQKGISSRDDSDPLHPLMFTVPNKVLLVGKAIERRFKQDYPFLRPILDITGIGRTALFRPELVPALGSEKMLIQTLAETTDDEFENVILPMSRIPGVNAIVLAAMILNDVTKPMEIKDWIGGDVTTLPRKNIPNRPDQMQTLPAPGEATNGQPAKYLIFSDVHRDGPQDQEFKVDHFLSNQKLYLKALDWAENNGHIVLEAGDLEELWYVPTFAPGSRQTKLDRVKSIYATHEPVYKKLASLAKQGRYHRAIGNHDSYLWEDADVIAWRNSVNFPTLHGGFVIPQCKTMDDFMPHIGLNPEPYSNRTAMLILHGHQFDFWNCDEHNRLGKFITNAVAVPGDALDDAIYQYRGVDRLGHPLVEFWDLLTHVTPWTSWPPFDVAREWAQDIEQRPIAENVVQDSVFFSETFAAAVAATMRLGPAALSNYSVLLCLGHTHNPQSRPWVQYLEQFNPWHDKEVASMRLFDNLFSLKTRYLNTGTVGWWEGVIWAIEVTEQGQPRLLYWSAEDSEPIAMDWELDGTKTTTTDAKAFGEWAKRFLADADEGLNQLFDSISSSGKPRVGAFTAKPTFDGVAKRLSDVAKGMASFRPNLPQSAATALASVSSSNKVSADPFSLATLLLAAGQELAANNSGIGSIRRPPRVGKLSAAAPLKLWPHLAQGAAKKGTVPRMSVGSVIKGLVWSYKPGKR